MNEPLTPEREAEIREAAHGRVRLAPRGWMTYGQDLLAEVHRLRAMYNASSQREHDLIEERDRLQTRVVELEAAAQKIRHLHTDSPMGPCPVCVNEDALARGDDYTVPWPCPTAQHAGAVDQQTGGA